MLRRNLAFFISLVIVSSPSFATDLDHSVSGDSNQEDILGSSTEASNSPYIIEGEDANLVEKSKTKGEDHMFNHGVKEVSGNQSLKKKYEDFGYVPPGTFEDVDNYIEIDKPKMAKDFRKASSGSINMTYIKNDYNYSSTNDIINRTIGSGYRSMKGGTLYIRHDAYMTKTMALNTHWSLGGAVGYNTGKGIFVGGTRSDTTFSLWEVPIDGGVGIEIPIYHWFKIAGTGGGSIMTLLQNRSDYQRGEDGKRKFQFSPGYFANAQFKVNLSGFSDNVAYDLFTASEITNLYMNIEIRHQNYSNFQDPITISGTSFGIGFTFEYL